MTFADKLFDESEHQRPVARALGLNSNEVQCGQDDIYKNFAQVIWHAESPLFRTAPVPMYLAQPVCRVARRQGRAHRRRL